MILKMSVGYKTVAPLCFVLGLAPAFASERVKAPLLPDSGQTHQYDTEGKMMSASDSSLYTGQDASVQGNALRYQDNGDGTITDLNTGLMWQQAHDFTRRIWPTR